MTKAFWNKEYKSGEHLALSTEPSSDLETFVHWAERNAEWPAFPKDGFILDVGCGNGRNIIPLAKEAGMKGFGFDISGEAITQARKAAGDLPIEFETRSASDDLPLPDESVDVVLDMMTSHFLKKEERDRYLQELVRVMKPYAWLFFKSFLLEGDQNAHRMIKENPGGEENSYIHPRIGVYEYVWTESALVDFFSPYFKIHKMIKSYKHVMDGKPWKRRTVSLYLEKKREY
ncbi:MAG: class I SAM-dependent methyltransferase [Candidatus Paceibacterota bacterium]|jgi:ubiquinone/menaquinone biosynthesis C-methylase UbiE